jgi:hypothetical protein
MFNSDAQRRPRSGTPAPARLSQLQFALVLMGPPVAKSRLHDVLVTVMEMLLWPPVGACAAATRQLRRHAF